MDTQNQDPLSLATEQSDQPQAKPRSQKSKNLVVDLYTGLAESTFQQSPYWPESFRKPYNPDDLFQRTNDYSLYEEMLNDDQVSVCVEVKRDLVIGDGWDIQAEVSDGSQDAIKEDIEVALEEDPEISIEEMLEEWTTAYNYGFSLSEKIFKYRDDNSLTLKNVKTRHPSTWKIYTDPHGNIEKYIQHGPQGDIKVEPKSLIHFVNNRRFGNPYGRSDLRSAYNAWFVKRQIVKWYGIFLEKHASPTPVARYDRNAPQTAVNVIHESIKSLQTKTALTIPKDIEVDFLESKSNGEAYEKGLNIFNMFIGRALLIPDLMGFQGKETGGGSYAMGKEQLKIFFLHVQRRRSVIERLVNKHLIWPIVVTNHGFVDNYPKFKLRPISEDQLLEFAKTWLDCVKGKTYKPSDEEINHFRSIVHFPEGDVEREAPTPVDANGNPIPPGFQSNDPSGNAGGNSGGNDKGAAQGAAPGGQKGEKNPKDAGAPAAGKQFSAKIYSQPPGQFDERVDYSAIQSAMDSQQAKVVNEAEPIVKRIFEDLYSQIRSKKILDSDPSKLASLKLKSPKDLNLLLTRSLREGYKSGMLSGQRELLKVKLKAPLPDNKFLDVLDSETYNYIGDWVYSVEKDARIRIMQAIKDGKPLSAVIDMLDENDLPDSITSIERYSRTKFTEVMNRGRLASFSDSGVIAAYQFSAILDDRSSEICAGLHGKIFTEGTEPVPPLHFNCRSLLIPITKYEDFQADDEVGGKPIDDFIEENKGDGFPIG